MTSISQPVALAEVGAGAATAALRKLPGATRVL